ncbi:Rieske (2Fe-2S) protein [Streptomyces fulvorobeus]|uniref:Cytochrome bc1 complex Rieske iron-sulfur subunit n=1 Tax=Streptomyces fulvorobeus TaxID=284028 RepID=A0A7J0C042_9ACTN|nr:Rieske (2Fe-2S) protein [Streptomyces fulvorobeus]NYE39637.1 Rieske Fe-S protein [Streptomyces fulvorobeus]GFM95879.1 iron-sulfur protein [Streptomyces fulvorobeus]
MSAGQECQGRLGRRTVVNAVGAAGVVAVLAACGSEQTGKTGETGKGGAADTSGEALAKTADIPEGGGVVFADQGVVVTQPKAGEFKAFSSKCTHQGCSVKGISEGVINCPCHGSTFDAATGAVTGGPATQPLPAKAIKVEAGSISLV